MTDLTRDMRATAVAIDELRRNMRRDDPDYDLIFNTNKLLERAADQLEALEPYAEMAARHVSGDEVWRIFCMGLGHGIAKAIKGQIALTRGEDHGEATKGDAER